MKRCLQWTAATAVGSLDPFSMAKYVVNRLKRAESLDWMASCPSLRGAIFTNNLSMPALVDVVANIDGVWPLVVTYLRETARKDNGDSFVVKRSLLGILFASSQCIHCCFVVLKKGKDEFLYHDQFARARFRPFPLLEICRCHHHFLIIIHVVT